MAAVDPTEEERAAITDMKAALACAGFDVTAPDDETTVAGSLLKHVGVASTTLPRVIGIFPDADLAEGCRCWWT